MTEQPLSKSFNLEERTAKFGENIIDLCRRVREDAVSKSIISQIVRSSTSVGANYMEANCASSKKDFRNKIFICKKEAQETKHWLRMLNKLVPNESEVINKLHREAHELVLIFQKISSSLKIENCLHLFFP